MAIPCLARKRRGPLSCAGVTRNGSGHDANPSNSDEEGAPRLQGWEDVRAIE
ncbi:MAG: hypothetical protein JRN66_07075 [Nitrososphaerota archaeon]|nr:hypothetical protein [Nitrososphaerota archaeon]